MNRYWLKCAVMRSVKTVAQTACAVIGSACVLSEVEWKVVASASILAGILSLLTSVAGLPEVELLDESVEDELEFDDEEEEEEDETEV